MKIWKNKILTILVGSIVLIAAALGLYLYQSNMEAVQFTSQLNELQEQDPEVVTSQADEDRQILTGDVKKIQSIYQKHNEAWCEGDGLKYSSVFTEDADFISFDGTHTIGREEIANSHQELFDTFLKNTCLRGYVKRIKFLNEDTAVVYVLSGTKFGDSQVVQRPSIQTYVAVKKGEAWLFTGFHNGRIDRVENRNIFRKMWLGFQTVVLQK